MPNYSQLFLTTTDTVVGLGGPVNQNNFEAIYALKGRDKSKPLIIMLANIEEARKLEGWDEKAEALAQKYWPGATTLVINPTLALRIPQLPGLIRLLEIKGPCYMTSANLSGEPTYSLAKAKTVFHEITEVYDFGPSSGVPSKIIDVQTGKVLR